VGRFILIALSVITWGSAAVGLAAQGGRINAFLDLLTHLAPLYIAVGVMALVLAAVLRRPALMLALPGLVSAAAGLALMLPDMMAERGPRPLAGAPTLKIIQFNVWGGNPNVDRTVAWLLAQNADIIVLEESGGVGPYLVKGGYRKSCEWCATNIFSKTEAIESNGPEEWFDRRPKVSSATFRDSFGPFTLLGVHLPWPNKFVREKGAYAALKAMVGEHPSDRLIIVGDFNSTPWSFQRQREDADLGVLRRTRNLFSWPAEQVSHNKLPALFPVLPIDHVYAGPGWATVSVQRGPRLGSDHYPIVAVLAPAEGQAPPSGAPRSK
jgi:endonuclease/exonuclease/phosphatase (EEP) superfamily protein YafD